MQKRVSKQVDATAWLGVIGVPAQGLLSALIAFVCIAFPLNSGAAAEGVINRVIVRPLSDVTRITLHFNCSVNLLSYGPKRPADLLTIQVEPLPVCTGVSTSVLSGRDVIQPNDPSNQILEVQYDSEGGFEARISLRSTDEAEFRVYQSSDLKRLDIEMNVGQERRTKRSASTTEPGVVINLDSAKVPYDLLELQSLARSPGLNIYQVMVDIEDATWHQLRLGPYPSEEAAENALTTLKQSYPKSWVAKATDADLAAMTAAKELRVETTPEPAVVAPQLDPVDSERLAAIVAEAKTSMLQKDLNRAIALYTKVLQYPPNEYSEHAQEYLALARERNGQIAHAKAEYKKYLKDYPEGEAVARVQQRLAAIVSVGIQRNSSGKVVSGGSSRKRTSKWQFSPYLSQYYRRDSNQFNEQEELISQSAVITDLDLTARRRGERFDLLTRLSAGYSHDFLDEDVGPGNRSRVSFAYVDTSDEKWKLRTRIGRQSRNTGGVLGRFDGIHIARDLGENLRLNFTSGYPVDSSRDGFDTERSFYGVSLDLGTYKEAWDFTTFYNHQNISGVEDRSAIGGEVRYVDSNKSFISLVDYDIAFSELNNVFFQGNWRFDNKLTVNALVDRRHAPFLTTRNAIVGQAVFEFDELLPLFTEAELQQLALDRTALSTTYSLGLTKSLTPTMQITGDVTRSDISSTIESGGVLATPASESTYLSSSLVLSSLFKQGDVFITSLRYGDLDTYRSGSFTLDTRFPFGNGFRINPRIRVDRRDFFADDSTQWIYSPRVRLQYRWRRKYTLELEAGGEFSDRQLTETTDERTSYFMSLGYRFVF